MLSKEKEAWLQKLPSDKQVTIVPFDPTAEVKYEEIKRRIQNVLGTHIPVVHRGSTSLGISGQDEIDVYIPTPPKHFNELFEDLKKLFGEPRSILPLQRIRFVTDVDGKHIDLFLINKEHSDWIDGTKFEAICRENSEIKQKYQQLKEDMNGWTIQDFYRKKNEFIASVLEGKI